MDNFEYRPHSTCYEYVVASLPVLSQNWKANPKLAVDEIVNEIKELCSRKDVAIVDFMMKAYDRDQLTKEFYEEAAKSENRFIREFFEFDRQVRNCKVKYLNRSLGVAETEGIVLLREDETVDEMTTDLIMEVLNRKDLIERENGLDAIMWEKIDQITTYDYFDMNVVLAFLAKLQIINRWLKLDEAKGREMFRALVEEVRGTFKGVEFNDNQ